MDSMKDIKEKIFANGMTPSRLKYLMHETDSYTETRFKLVSFANIDADNGPRTVEFRQQHGTLDDAEINEWIVLVTTMMRTAERKARSTPLSTVVFEEAAGENLAWNAAEGLKYNSSFADVKARLEEFFTLLGITGAWRQALLDRWHRYWEGNTIFTYQEDEEWQCPVCGDPDREETEEK